jgi:hypothetical protein
MLRVHADDGDAAMQRHLTDTARSRETPIKLREYLRVARDERGHKAPKVLHRRAHAPRSTVQLQAFLDIERGRRA